METPVRSIAKAMSWQLTGLVSMTAIAWLVTGNLAASGGLAVLAAVVGFLMFFVHERIWARVRWGVRGSAAANRVGTEAINAMGQTAKSGLSQAGLPTQPAHTPRISTTVR